MKKYFKYILHAAILIGLGVAAVKYLNAEEVLQALRAFDYRFATPILALSGAYLFLKGLRFVVLMRPLTNLPWSVLVRGYVAGTAATLLPGGVAARAGLMSQAGVPVERSGAPVFYSSFLDQAVLFAGLLGAALWFPAARVPALVVILILAAAGLVLWIPWTRSRLSRFAEWVAGRFKVVEKWRTFLHSIGEVSTPRILLVSLAITFVGLVMQIVILDLCLRGLDRQVPYPTLFLAYIIPAILGRNSALPAGIGLTEAGMVGFLSSAAQVDADLAAAAVAIYRVATVPFQALLGTLVFFFFWRGEGEAKAPARKPGRALAFKIPQFRKSPKGDQEG